MHAEMITDVRIDTYFVLIFYGVPFVSKLSIKKLHIYYVIPPFFVRFTKSELTIY